MGTAPKGFILDNHSEQDFVNFPPKLSVLAQRKVSRLFAIDRG